MVSADDSTAVYSAMNNAADAYYSEFWWWLWQGKDGHLTIGEKKAELRAKYGAEAEAEVIRHLRLRGLLKDDI